MKTQKIMIKCLLLLLFISCSKNDDDVFTPSLPPISQTGSNTFGCYIDGILVTPRDGSGANGFLDPGLIFWGSPTGFNYNEISVIDFKSGDGGLIDIHITDLHENGEGIYPINESNCQDNVDANQNINVRCRWWDESLESYKWYCSIENGGSLTITRYDYNNFIVSGTFSCTVRNTDDPNDIIEITEGRFDIKWNVTATFP